MVNITKQKGLDLKVMSQKDNHCANEYCSKKEGCGRFLAKLNKTGVTWFANFKPNLKGDCWHFVPKEIPKSSYAK